MYFVYSKPNCAFCEMAKSLLKSKGLPYSEVVLDVGQIKEEGIPYIDRTSLLVLFPGAKTMPQISYAEHPAERRIIGGYAELKRELES